MQIKIGIIEDEVIIADSIAATLRELGYEPLEPCSNYEEALLMLENQDPSLVILDINLAYSKNGFEIARHIREYLKIPFIFLTASSDKITLEGAKTVHPDGFLVKPFQKLSLYSTIEIAMHNFNKLSSDRSATLNTHAQNALFIKDGNYFHKVPFEDILYLSSDHVYVTVHTAQRKYLVRAAMQQYLEKFDLNKFVRVHRSYVVNMDRVEKINPLYLMVNGEQVPISKNHRNTLLGMLNLA